MQKVFLRLEKIKPEQRKRARAKARERERDTELKKNHHPTNNTTNKCTHNMRLCKKRNKKTNNKDVKIRKVVVLHHCVPGQARGESVHVRVLCIYLSTFFFSNGTHTSHVGTRNT
jgi:hypothetical protein